MSRQPSIQLRNRAPRVSTFAACRSSQGRQICGGCPIATRRLRTLPPRDCVMLRIRCAEQRKTSASNAAWRRDKFRSTLRTDVCFGVEKGPRWRGDRRPKGTPLVMGFTMALGTNGGLERDAGGGDGREDSAGVFCAGQGDQGDLPRVGRVAEGRSEGSAVGGDGVSLRA